MSTYTIEQVTIENLYNIDLLRYFQSEMPALSKRFDDDFNYKNLKDSHMERMVQDCMFYICRKNGEISGHLICELINSTFDPEVKILNQISLYAKPGSGRTAWHLFQKYIDIGKARANHIFTMLTSETNIKPSTLENMGFKYAETVYRMEIK